MGIGAVDTTSPLCMRTCSGMHGTAFANYTVDDCDFLIALGSRFDDRVAGVPAKFARNAKRIAHIDIDRAEVNKVKRVQWAHIGSLAEALRTLTGVRQAYEVPARLRAVAQAHPRSSKTTYAMNYDRNSELIQPYYVIEEINKHAEVRRSSRPASASTRCGPRSTAISARRGCGSRRAAWARWASACRRPSARRLRIRTGSSSTSTATRASA